MRTILFTGKGGVGKTTLAAATGLRAAAGGARTLVLSADGAHSLADCLDCELAHDPREVAPGFFAAEVHPLAALRDHWSIIQRYLSEFLISQGLDPVQAEELCYLPGMDELFSLLQLKDYADGGKYDLIVLDCAPTGMTSRMLSLPDAFRWYMDRFFKVERAVTKVVRPVAERLVNFKLPRDEVYEALEKLYHRVLEVRDFLLDREQASIRLVTLPERMVVAETARAFGYLSLFGFNIDAIIVNRLLDSKAGRAAALKSWSTRQRKYLGEIHETFGPVPILECSLQADELGGIDELAALGAGLYGELPAEQVLHERSTMALETLADGYRLNLYMPGVDKKDLSVWVSNDQLFIEVKNLRRNLPLPAALTGLDLVGAALTDGNLRVNFTKAA